MKVLRKLNLPAGRRELKGKALKEKRYFYFVIGAILALALLSRFILLADRPMHHDEGMLAYFAWRLSDFREYIYTPQIHAPILFYVQAIIYKIAKVSDYTSRVGPAIFSLVLISLPLLIYRKTEMRKGIFLAVLFLVSPLFLYFFGFFDPDAVFFKILEEVHCASELARPAVLHRALGYHLNQSEAFFGDSFLNSLRQLARMECGPTCHVCCAR